MDMELSLRTQLNNVLWNKICAIFREMSHNSGQFRLNHLTQVLIEVNFTFFEEEFTKY